MSVEQYLHESHLQRHVNALIVSYLRDHNFTQAAAAVASATMTPLNVEVPMNKLLDLVSKGISVDRDENPRGVMSAAGVDLALSGGINFSFRPLPILSKNSLDFSSAQPKGQPKVFPKHDARHISEHKGVARCARFSPDGRFFATGSADMSIKLFEVEKIRQMLMTDNATREGTIRPVIRTFYDHMQPINDLDFHPQSAVLASGAKDRTIKFFDFAKTTAKRAFRVIQDTHNVRSVAFHPCGDFLLAGTDHPVPHLYDVNTFQCYLSSSVQEGQINDAINQIRYSGSGGMYVTASKDGGIRLWDGVSASCVRAIELAHGSFEATSASFTKDQRYILSCGKDSAVRVWDVGSGQQVKQYLGAQHNQLRCQAIFNHTEEFVLCTDEISSEIVVWDSLTGEMLSRLQSGHNGAARWLEHSPSESAFVTCGMDRSVRYWREAF